MVTVRATPATAHGSFDTARYYGCSRQGKRGALTDASRVKVRELIKGSPALTITEIRIHLTGAQAEPVADDSLGQFVAGLAIEVPPGGRS